jgi:hypothetical protein
LFEDVTIDLLEKGIKLTPLFESEIFNYVFEFESWPPIHEDSSDYMVPFNGSKFHLKDNYKGLFNFLVD